jgi:hypothetical protein
MDTPLLLGNPWCVLETKCHQGLPVVCLLLSFLDLLAAQLPAGRIDIRAMLQPYAAADALFL